MNVCTLWKQVFIETYPLIYAGRILSQICRACETFETKGKDLEKRLRERPDGGQNEDELGRVTYLIETITDLQKLLITAKETFITLSGEPLYRDRFDKDTPHAIKIQKETTMLHSFVKISEDFKHLLVGALDLFSYYFIERQDYVTENFDMLEILIRRYFHQLSHMFITSTTLLYPSQCITNEPMRQVWLDKFGDVYWVSWDLFNRTFVIPFTEHLQPDVRERVTSAIMFVVHFPSLGYVTSYLFHLLGCLWGPYDKLLYNLETYASTPGFLGILNMYGASKIMKQHSNVDKSRLYIIRFSRLCPDRLTITYINKKGHVTNIRLTPYGDLSASLAESFSEHTPVPQQYDVILAVANSKSLRTYTACETPYIEYDCLTKNRKKHTVVKVLQWEGGAKKKK
eukprot:TRINITY_DN12831_c0_g1_i1.p1 TRINITY_DN12831_c0_g1~~TRINITY_DN12831_c0_g1_i1.p1  ORF type:complete len:427 (-),score=48.66 TRINITY_DN12831_c0_g1_i1:220-1416(-)